MDRMRAYTPTMNRKSTLDSSQKSELDICFPDDWIIYLSCKIYGYNGRHHENKASWDLHLVAIHQTRFRISKGPTSWFRLPYTAHYLAHTICHTPSARDWHHLPPPSYLPVHGACNSPLLAPGTSSFTFQCLVSTTQQVSGLSLQECTWKHIVEWKWEHRAK